MKGHSSTELIEFFDKREKELGEKANPFNMFLEGYFLGYRTFKRVGWGNLLDFALAFIALAELIILLDLTIGL